MSAKEEAGNENTNENLFEFPLLIDSSVRGGVITNDTNMKNTKEKLAECNLELSTDDGVKEQVNFFADYETLYNINYEMKSFINQVKETIKNFNK